MRLPMHVFGLARSEFFCFDSVTVHLQFRLPLQSVFDDAICHFRRHRKLYPSKIHRNIFYIAIEKQGTQSFTIRKICLKVPARMWVYSLCCKASQAVIDPRGTLSDE